MKKYYLIYGNDGHRQKASFWGSIRYELEDYDMTVLNADETGTNDFSVVIIDGEENKNRGHLDGQISDGYFENCNVGKVTEISEDAFRAIMS